MTSVSRRAFGKLNLGLRVLSKRKDGYHEVSTVMVAVELSDVLYFSPRDEGLLVVCPSVPDLRQEDNLVVRAAQLLLSGAREPGLAVTIEKNIPPGSGMGGGSSDAAATLLVVNEMLPLDERRDMATLMRTAAAIGADVPFLLGCDSIPPIWEAALCTGIGETVRPLPAAALGGGLQSAEGAGREFAESLSDVWVVLTFPDFEVNTSRAYRDWDESSEGGAGEEAQAALLSALTAGDKVAIAHNLFNDLEGPVSRRYPSIRAIKERLVQCGALGACMTGSGSAVFGICGSEDEARRVRSKMEEFSRELRLKAVVVTRMGCGT